ncbi:hypothetical protein KEM56_000858 [Ascosphaera pollenicola]|nr:hypothetical protein KEM56_000858 [Ascosphaera pollenicola]
MSSALSHLFVPSHVQVYSVALAQAQYKQQCELQRQHLQQQQQEQKRRNSQKSTNTESSTIGAPPSTATGTAAAAIPTAATTPSTTMIPSSTSTSISIQSIAESHASSNTSQFTSKGPPPLIEQQGRVWIGDPTLAYPLPCDPFEVARQIINIECLSECYGHIFCNSEFLERPPKRVLEVACGSGVWSHKCHNYFKSKGYDDIEFYGVDIVDIAPDLRRQGVNWTFKQCDIRELRAPFPAEFFDFIFIKDSSLIRSPVPAWLELWMNYIRPGGVIEVWETDHVFRALLPHPPPAPGLPKKCYEQAEKTGTYTICSSTPWTDVKNKFLIDYNVWIQQVFSHKGLSTTPCSHVGLSFSTEGDSLENTGSRRIAIPLGHMQWEKDDPKSAKLTGLQLALRRIFLYTVSKVMRCLNEELIVASQKTPEEWSRWWSQLSKELVGNIGFASGECLEAGAWWGTKRAKKEGE